MTSRIQDGDHKCRPDKISRASRHRKVWLIWIIMITSTSLWIVSTEKTSVVFGNLTVSNNYLDKCAAALTCERSAAASSAWRPGKSLEAGIKPSQLLHAAQFALSQGAGESVKSSAFIERCRVTEKYLRNATIYAIHSLLILMFCRAVRRHYKDSAVSRMTISIRKCWNS